MRFRRERCKCYAIAVLLTALVFAGCSKKLSPDEGYNKLQQKNVSDFESAPILLIIGKDTQAALEITDSVATYDTVTGLRSYFKNFAAKLQPGKAYKVSLSSICDCAGFNKYLFAPELRIISETGIQTDVQPIEQPRFDYRFGPLSLNMTYTFKTLSGGNYVFSVFAANDNLNKPFYQFLTIPVPIRSNVRKAITGKFHIKLEEK